MHLMVCSRLRCFMRSPPPLPITNLSLVGLSFARAHVQTQVFCTVPSTGLPLDLALIDSCVSCELGLSPHWVTQFLLFLVTFRSAKRNC